MKAEDFEAFAGTDERWLVQVRTNVYAASAEADGHVTVALRLDPEMGSALANAKTAMLQRRADPEAQTDLPEALEAQMRAILVDMENPALTEAEVDNAVRAGLARMVPVPPMPVFVVDEIRVWGAWVVMIYDTGARRFACHVAPEDVVAVTRIHGRL